MKAIFLWVRLSLFMALLAPLVASAKIEPAAVSLNVAFVADAPRPMVAFQVRNESATDLPRGDLAVHPNAIHLLTPNGVVNVFSVISDPQLSAAPRTEDERQSFPVIRPGEQWTWEQPVEMVLSESDRAGVYRLYWEFRGVRSNELRILRRPGTNWDGTTRPAIPELYRESRGPTPVSVVLTFFRAMDGEKEFSRWLLAYPDRDKAVTMEELRTYPVTKEMQVAQALQQRARAAERFRRAAAKRFGDAALNVRLGFERSSPEIERTIEGAKVEYDEHFLHATVTPAKHARAYRLLRRGEGWELMAEDFVDAADRRDWVSLTPVLEKLADSIRAGEFGSIEDVRSALTERTTTSPSSR